jgi:UDP-N-acetylglucosamine 2-epimerase (non-hydrolysing)
MHRAQAAAHRGQELDRAPESIETGFAHLVQPGPVISDLGRQLIADDSLSERLAATPCPYGDAKASERIAELLRGFLS